MNRSRVRDYASAEKWLLGARSKLKNERTLQETGVRLVRISPTEISVVLNWWGFQGSNRAITYRSDGVTILHSRAAYQSVRRIYMEYVKDLTMVIRKGHIVISLPSDGKSASKVTDCRTCKGVGTKPKECYGPGNRCWDDECEKYASTVELRKKVWSLNYGTNERKVLEELISTMEHKHDTCKHGYTAAHTCHNNRYDCYRCRTTGKVDYGNKQRGRVWSGSEDIGIDADGNYVQV